ncbi:extracellular solute-binding protein [Ktedonosporobacter rubrisoli]|uniref:Extracellular solute-binding protein n=1 Tax=Ktedonosporobacter rubrisoli TaxID=2509675 RepID=A0A4V0YY62_KTERU|nr:substrate-binding domain-containing protein [Ktedonosporobacter rubrisoli]QBD75111.1 extracellular solute-binding protein [Ktedonosporobacter rubrisoli]
MSTQPQRKSFFLQESFSRRSFLKTAATAFAASGGLGLGACGSSLSGTGKNGTSGTVTIWDRSGDLFQVFDATIASFNKKYPDITVKHVPVDVDSKLPSTLATGVNVPDGAFYEDNNLPVLAAHYYDITDWIQPYTKDIVPFKLRVNTHNGRIFGIPWDLDPGLLYYREDMLQGAGVDPASIETYDDLIAAAHKLQEKFGPTCKPIHLEQDPGVSQLWVEMFANQQGVSMVNEEGKLQIDSQPYLNIMNFLNRVRTENIGTRAVYISPGDVAAVENNQIAFYPWAIWAVYGPDLLFKKTRGKWRAMPLPAWKKGGARGAVMGGSSFIIPKKAKNPHLAWLFYEHLVFSPEGYTHVYGPNKIYPGGLNTSLPSYLPALKKQLFQNPEGLGNQNLWEVATGTVKDIPGNFTYAPWYNQAISYFGANIQLLLDGKLTPEQVLQKSASQIQTNLIARQ